MAEQFTSPVVHFNSTGMDPQTLANAVNNLIDQGYKFIFDHRGWKYFAFYPNGEFEKK